MGVGQGSRAQTSSPATVLTEREQDVLELLPSLQSVDEIAKDLAVSRNTVKTHMRSIYQKLGADDRRDAVHRSRRAGLLTAFEQANAAQRDLRT